MRKTVLPPSSATTSVLVLCTKHTVTLDVSLLSIWHYMLQAFMLLKVSDPFNATLLTPVESRSNSEQARRS